MADVKPATTVRSGAIRPSTATPVSMRADPRPPVDARAAVEDREIRSTSLGQLDPASAAVAAFIMPSQRTMAWLGDARLTATLQAASETLAPGGVAEDATDRYAASVIETHLVARARLSKLTNALLKT